MDRYNFKFKPSDCNHMYFKELLILLDDFKEDRETFKRTKHKHLQKLDINCTNIFNTCEPDEFFFDDNKQIVLGRLMDTIGCFNKCKAHYYSMAIDTYSIFKNDLFIRFVIDKPHLYINNSTKIKLEDIFPMRILLNKYHVIPKYKDKKMEDIREYTYDEFKNKAAITNHNMKIIHKLPNDSLLKKFITDGYPNSSITSRELCLLYHMKLHFYQVHNEDNTIKPFILLSKYNISEIKRFYKKHNKVFPKIEYLFKPYKKTLKHKRRNHKTRKNI